MKRIVSILAAIICMIPVQAGNTYVKVIKGTSLAELSDAYAVMQRLSLVIDDGTSFYIAGQDRAAIYVDGRRLSRHSDLMTIPARIIEQIEIITEPRAEYGNRGNVILITTVKPTEDEFKLEDAVDLAATPFPGGTNDIEISGKKGKFIYKGGLVAGYVGSKASEQRFEDLYAVQAGSDAKWLNKRTVKSFSDINKDISADIKGKLGYQITPEHLLSLRYEYDYLHSGSNWDDLQYKIYKRQGRCFNPYKPTDSYNAESSGESDRHRHSLSFAYEGEIDDWKITANLDLYGGRKKGRDLDIVYPGGIRKCTKDKQSLYEYGEDYIKAKALHPLWKGTVDFGVALDDYLQTTFTDDATVEDDIVHARTYCFVPMAFSSLNQTFGTIKMDVGFLYELALYGYKPFDDDETMKKIIEKTGRRDIFWSKRAIHPHLTISTKIGEADLSTGVYTNTSIPSFTDVSIDLDKLEKGSAIEALPQIEVQKSVFVKGMWKWVNFKGWGTHYHLPLFLGIGEGYKYNGPDYWSMDWRLTVSPSIAFWETSLTATVHKQWLDMSVVDPVDNLCTPRGTFQWTNGFVLPWGMRFDINSFLRTTGADRNMYYREPTWNIDSSIQQSFLKSHLTVSLTVDNLAGNCCDRIAFYMAESVNELDFKEKINSRIFKITLRYTL